MKKRSFTGNFKSDLSLFAKVLLESVSHRKHFSNSRMIRLEFLFYSIYNLKFNESEEFALWYQHRRKTLEACGTEFLGLFFA